MNFEKILEETNFSSALSSGAGGQHVNKTETKVNLIWDIHHSSGLNDDEKHRVLRRLQNKINKKGQIQMSCSETRSQHQNKKILIQKFKSILQSAIIKPKKRKQTRPTKASKLKRLKSKAEHAQKKARRKKPDSY